MTLKNGVCSVTFDCCWIASSMAMVSIVFETLPSVTGVVVVICGPARIASPDAPASSGTPSRTTAKE